MLPKPLYEVLPYGYFIVGSILWLVSQTPLELIAGALLYFAGAQQWILRSNYRRIDRIRSNLINRHLKQASQQFEHKFHPQWLYEILPFVYIALGFQLANLMHSSSWSHNVALDISFSLASSLCLIIAGFLILVLRSQHRLQSSSSEGMAP